MQNLVQVLDSVVGLLVGVGLFVVIIRIAGLVEKITKVIEKDSKDSQE